jgi:hypothetical protein
MGNVTRTKTLRGAATPIKRLSHLDRYVSRFAGRGDGVAIRVLGPVETTLDGAPALRSYGAATSKNTNGNSLLLRLDYKRARIVLTGDLNTDSQRALLDDYVGDRIALQCDVAKACHHGSDDVSYEFLSAMRPAVTVISSWDSEGHDHLRPAIVAASATTGYLQIAADRIVTPRPGQRPHQRRQDPLRDAEREGPHLAGPHLHLPLLRPQSVAAIAPPSATRCAPETKAASSEARNSAQRAMSSGSPTRPSGMPWPSRAACSARATMSAVSRVRIVPGQIAFTRMPSRP